jgi:hypothetical protein
VSAFVILYASEIGHRAYEYIEKKQGYFSWFLVEALRGAAANDRGEVTLGGVIDYLQEKVPQRVALDLGKGKAQKPFAVIEGFKANDLVLSFVPQMTRVTQNLPPVGRARTYHSHHPPHPSSKSQPSLPRFDPRLQRLLLSVFKRFSSKRSQWIRLERFSISEWRRPTISRIPTSAWRWFPSLAEPTLWG